jgi:hypothetical protein
MGRLPGVDPHRSWGRGRGATEGPTLAQHHIEIRAREDVRLASQTRSVGLPTEFSGSALQPADKLWIVQQRLRKLPLYGEP